MLEEKLDWSGPPQQLRSCKLPSIDEIWFPVQVKLILCQTRVQKCSLHYPRKKVLTLKNYAKIMQKRFRVLNRFNDELLKLPVICMKCTNFTIFLLSFVTSPVFYSSMNFVMQRNIISLKIRDTNYSKLLSTINLRQLNKISCTYLL